MLFPNGRDSYMETERRSHPVEVTAGRTLDVEPLAVASRDRSIAGIVVDPDGKPVEGANVNAFLRASPLPQQIPGALPAQPTGKDGRFTLRGMPNLPLTLKAFLMPAGPNSRWGEFDAVADVEPGQTDVRIVLDPRLFRGKM